MKPMPPILLLLVTLLSTPAPAVADLEDELATQTRALALGPDGQSVALTYHPGSLTVLALLGAAGEPAFSALHGVNGRGRFITSWQVRDELLAAFVPEGACDGGFVLRIAITAATRAHESQLRPYRGALRPGTTRLSIHASVNGELPVVIDNWGDLDRRSWPGTERFELPEGACALRWSEGRLALRQADGTLANWAPPTEASPQRGAPLRRPGGERVAALARDDEALQLPSGTVPLTGFDSPTLLGLGPNDQPWLSARSDATGGLPGVFRLSADGLELVFADPRFPVESATRLPDSDRLLSIDYGPGNARRYFVDNTVSARLRALRDRTGERHELLDVVGTAWLTATDTAFWLVREDTPPVRVEDRRPWSDAPIAVVEQLRADGLLRQLEDPEPRPGDEPAPRRLAVPDATHILPAEARGLLALGVPLLLDAAPGGEASPPRCRWSRSYQEERSITEIACPAGTRTWEAVLTRESATERSARIRGMATFVGGQ